MAASYPTSVKSFSTKSTTDVVEASHPNDLQDEVTAIETALLTGGLAHNVIPSGTRTLGNSSTFWDKGYLTALILGAETTSGIRLEVDGGVLGVREGDDSAYGPLKALTLEATSNGVIGGTLAVTGATTLAALSATTGTFSSTLAVTGVSTLTGFVGIGGISPVYPLEVGSSVNGGEVVKFNNSNATSPYGMLVTYSAASPNNTTNWFFKGADSTTDRVVLRANGGIANYSANDVNLSDDSAKDYDAPLTEADITGDVAAFLNLEIRRGKYKDAKDSGKSLMFSAQQVKRTKPEWSAMFDEKKGLMGTKEHAILMAAYATIRQLDKRVAALGG